MSPIIVKFLSCFIFSQKKRKLFRSRHSGLVTRYRHYHKTNKIGIGSYLGTECSISHKDTVIGNFCSIANGVYIGTTAHPTNFLSTHPFQYRAFSGLPGEIPEEKRCSYTYKRPVHVGNDVWIGLNAVLLDGIQVGDGAIIGAHAVVTKDVPPYAIVGGVPARIIRYRFSEEIIAQLLQLKWWDLPMEQIQNLPFDNIEECIRKLQVIRKQNDGAGS